MALAGDRLYTDRAVQTGEAAPDPRQGTPSPGESCEPAQAIPTHFSADVLPPPTSPALSTTRRVLKIPPFPQNRPTSNFLDCQRRLVSLPEASVSQPMTTPDHFTGQRIVSMPERPRTFVQNLASPIDISLLTTSETSLMSSDDGKHSGLGEFSSSEPLKTPSPPSSPESVLIIGNNMQVPSSFLTQNRKQENTDRGWISWSESPKPIPALHGPLSLPYARCPSGAEGTVVEEGNLDRVIWGLENDGLVKSRVAEEGHLLHSPKIAASQLPSRNVRHPMEPPIVLPPPLTIDIHSPHILHNHRFGLFRERPFIGRDTDSGIIDYDWRTGDAASLPDESPVLEHRGLGIKWPGCAGIPDQKRTSPHRSALDTTALSFVPRSQQEPRLPPHRPTAVELAQQYHAAQIQTSAVPLKSIPLEWSPAFSTYSDQALSASSTPLLPTPRFEFSDFYNNHFDDFKLERPSNELRDFVQSRLAGLELNPSGISAPAYPDSQGICTSPLRQPSNHFIDAQSKPPYSLSPGKPPPTSPLPPTPGHSRKLNINSLSNVVAAPPSPSSPDFTSRNFSRQHPRSVPFTRLMQRRLSAVPEEDADIRSPPRCNTDKSGLPGSNVPTINDVQRKDFYSSATRNSGKVSPMRANNPRHRKPFTPVNDNSSASGLEDEEQKEGNGKDSLASKRRWRGRGHRGKPRSVDRSSTRV